MPEKYQSWWEDASLAEFVIQLTLRPRVVKRQIMVALERGQSPLTSDLETFSTLPPHEAESLLRLWEMMVIAREEVANSKK